MNLKIYEENYQEMKYYCFVKTYPTLSQSYLETTCTAGILELPTGERKLVRVYPVPYRYLKSNSQFPKHSWIKSKFRKRPYNKDVRKDSYEIHRDFDLQILEKYDVTKGSKKKKNEMWEKRKEIILPFVSDSLTQIYEDYSSGGKTLGIIKPDKIIDFIIEEDEKKKWDKKELGILKQCNLFISDKKPLAKIPYRFKYEFVSDGRTHTLSVTDWEVNMLYLNHIWKKDKDWKDKMRERLIDFMRERDLYFVVGNVYHTKSFIIIGLFYPPKRHFGII